MESIKCRSSLATNSVPTKSLQLGAGRLDRIVATKISKTESSERFELEARAIAAQKFWLLPAQCPFTGLGSFGKYILD
jgi:hypothetical protein